MPYGGDPRQIIYRADFFEQAGITELPSTYEEFLDVCKTLKEFFPDKVPCVIPMADATSGHVAMLLNSYNGTGFTDENLVATMNTPEQVENYTFIKALYDEGYISAGTAGYSSADCEKMFLGGDNCIYFGQSGGFVVGSAIEETIHVMPVLSGPSNVGNGANTVNVNALSAFSQTKYTLSTGKSMVLNARSLYPQFSQLEGERVLGMAVEKVLTGVDMQTALEDMDAKINKIIEDYKPE